MSKLPYRGNLDLEIPLEIRLEVYKKAILSIRRKNYSRYDLNTPQLCLLLPCILWNLDNFMKPGPNGYQWINCKSAFPEFGKSELIEISKVRKVSSNEETDNKRIEILLRAIVTVNKIIKNEIQ